jgi:hypothetical protein
MKSLKKRGQRGKDREEEKEEYERKNEGKGRNLKKSDKITFITPSIW